MLQALLVVYFNIEMTVRDILQAIFSFIGGGAKIAGFQTGSGQMGGGKCQERRSPRASNQNVLNMCI